MKRGPWSVFCQRHRSRTSYHSSTDWVLYRIKLSLLSNGQITIEKQYWSQWSVWTSNSSAIQCTTCFYAYISMCINFGVQITRILTNIVLHDRLDPFTKVPNISRFSVFKLDTHLLYIYQLELYQCIKTINMFRVGILPPEKLKKTMRFHIFSKIYQAESIPIVIWIT